MLHVSLFTPSCLILAHSMLQVKYWIVFLSLFVLRRGIYHGMPPFLSCIGIVVDRTNLPVLDSLLWAIVVSLSPLGNLYTTSLTVAPEECLCGGVDDIYPPNIDKIIMESYHQGIGDSTPDSFLVTTHVIFLTTDIYDYTTGKRCIQTEIGTALFVNFWEVISWNGGLSGHSILGYGKWRTDMIAH